DDASLKVHAGETLAIIGESGCGKSVWLKMMTGLIEPLQGKVMFKGEDVGKMTPADLLRLRRSVGYLFQGSALFDSMTVLENVSYALREHTKASDDAMRERVVQCLEWVGLEDRILELHPASLSGGMRKRVALARAIAIEPEVVLYDEPTQGLDPQSITRIAELIVGLKKRLSITSILVTHDMRSAFGVCDRIALLHDKKFGYVGTPEQFVASREPPVREFIAEALTEIWTVRPDLKQYLPV
ncbi:MAG: ATP-binding cassette domain-containing protein, partial [Myxococcota bacterium]